MSWFYNMKIATKLIIGFLLVAIIAGVVGIVGVINIQKISKLDEELYTLHTATMPNLANVARAYQRERVAIRNLFIQKNISDRQIYLDEIQELDKLIADNLVKFEAGIVSPEVRESFNNLSKAIDDFK